ncbi:MAG: hypothetical protein EA401_02290 [Planctomycetota bacterium]|nr:MAG: hypothetical protein EA401_02290 [Planctomycetota bacterium]
MVIAFAGLLLAGIPSLTATQERMPPTGPEDPILGGVAAAACATHGDEDGFRERAEALLRNAAALDMAPFRRGRWLDGHDPGTYTLPIAIARLWTGEGRDEALRIVNDERSRRETYHFAAVGWSRLIPLFHDEIHEQTRSRMTGVPGNWLNGRGTDNHEVMWRSAAVTLSSYRGGNARGMDWLKQYVRTMIAAGQAEWDSPRYQPYMLMGLLNIYDFSQDQAARAWAKAGLDYMAVAYALRNTGNIYAGPTSRGNSHSPGSSAMDAIGWLWWGGPGGTPDRSGQLRPAVYAATSSYRPPQVIGNIARRDLPQLPFVIEQGIPNYWTGLDAPTLPVEANQGHATIWVSRHATLGTAWYADDVCSQMIHLRAAATNAEGSNATSIVAGWPGLKDGRQTLMEGHCAVFGRKDNPQNHPYVRARHGQFAQIDNIAVGVADFPADAPDPWLYVTTRGNVSQSNGWYIFSMGAATVAVYPLGEAETAREGDHRLIRIHGGPGNRRAGFVLAMWDDVALAAAGVGNGMDRIAVDSSQWSSERRVGIRTLAGTTASVRHRPDQHFAEVLVNDQAPVRDRMYRSPYVNAAQTQLAISDGRQGYLIDVSGDVPRYRPLDGGLGDDNGSATETQASEEDSSRPPRAPRRTTASRQAPDDAHIASWQESLLALIGESLEAGHVPRFDHQRLGDTEVSVLQGDRIVLQARNARMALPIASLSHTELADLAGNVAAALDAPSAHALHAAFLRLAGELGSTYRSALRAAGEHAAEILAAWEKDE